VVSASWSSDIGEKHHYLVWLFPHESFPLQSTLIFLLIKKIGFADNLVGTRKMTRCAVGPGPIIFAPPHYRASDFSQTNLDKTQGLLAPTTEPQEIIERVIACLASALIVNRA
jgi:hypothetical protein